jgi:hypothetical protein
MHQLHHLVADAPWNDEEMLAEVRQQVLPAMQKHGPVVARTVDDTSFPQARQAFGGRCAAILPEVWCQDVERCRQAGIPEEMGFQTKPEIALDRPLRRNHQRRIYPGRGALDMKGISVQHLMSIVALKQSGAPRHAVA